MLKAWWYNKMIDEYNENVLEDKIVDLDLYNDGNIVVFGNAESGKETLLSTMIFDLICNYSSEEVNIYIRLEEIS